MYLQGLDGVLVNVEVDISSGMPSWEIVGLPDTSIRESRERVKTAIKNSGYEVLSRKYIINLSPADIRKEGSKLDLSIAIRSTKCYGSSKFRKISRYNVYRRIISRWKDK